jgi:hypothetical protein
MADTIKIKLHSMTDLITNSSTVIYTYSEASLNILKDMINEFFKAFKIDKACDDVFDLSVDFRDNYRYQDAFWDLEEDSIPPELKGITPATDYAKRTQRLNNYCDKVRAGEIAKPQWMKDVETGDNRPSTYLTINPKSPEHEELAKLIVKFLYSTESVEGEG